MGIDTTIVLFVIMISSSSSSSIWAVCINWLYNKPVCVGGVGAAEHSLTGVEEKRKKRKNYAFQRW